MRNKYYINISNGAITRNNTDQNAFHTVYANDEEIREIRNELEKMNQASLGSFIRAHIPIMPYHIDPQTDSYDASLYELYHLLYELGDEQTKDHIMSLDILSQSVVGHLWDSKKASLIKESHLKCLVRFN